MLRMSTTMDRSFMETAASRARCGRDTRSVLWRRGCALIGCCPWKTGPTLMSSLAHTVRTVSKFLWRLLSITHMVS